VQNKAIKGKTPTFQKAGVLFFGRIFTVSLQHKISR
jgi:hypothetical protein